MIRWHGEVASTMDEGHRLAEAGVPHGTTIVARVQTQGRGRRGNAWASPPGGLWLSVVCRPPGPEPMETLSVRIGEALAATLREQLPELPPVTVKWPNDLLVDGRKLAGVLCEARWEGQTPLWVVVGVGVNVANAIPAALHDVAVSLAMLGIHTAAEDLAGPLARTVAAAAGEFAG